LLLVLESDGSVSSQIQGILGLLIEVGRVIEGLGECVVGGKLQLIREPPVECEAHTLICRAGRTLELIDIAELRVGSAIFEGRARL
jgi:hypothetical protein